SQRSRFALSHGTCRSRYCQREVRSAKERHPTNQGLRHRFRRPRLRRASGKGRILELYESRRKSLLRLPFEKLQKLSPPTLPVCSEPRNSRMSVIPRKFYQPIAITVALAFLYFTVVVKLGNDWWHDENYSHGLLIPFVIAFIIWQERKQIGEWKAQSAT